MWWLGFRMSFLTPANNTCACTGLHPSVLVNNAKLYDSSESKYEALAYLPISFNFFSFAHGVSGIYIVQHRRR